MGTLPDTYLQRAFRLWADFSYRYAIWVIVTTGLIMVAMILSMANLTMDTSVEARLHKDDPIRQHFDTFQAHFGSDDVILVSVNADNGVDKDAIANIAALQQLLESTEPYVHEITSTMNARYTYGVDGELIVEELLEDYPQVGFKQRWPQETLEDYLLASPNYYNRLISAQGNALALIVELQTQVKDPVSGQFVAIDQDKKDEAVRAIRSQLNSFSERTNTRTVLAGNPVIQETLNRLILSDTGLTTGLAFTLTLLFLFVFFRRVSGMLIPLAVINGSLIVAIGMMALTGTPYTLTMGSLPAILVAIGVADSVHILSLFYRYYTDYGMKKEAVLNAVSVSAPAVLLTSLTTGAGFLSFVAADLASITDLGVFTAIAVFTALMLSVTLIPALLAVSRIKPVNQNLRALQWVNTLTNACVRLSIEHARVISAVAVVALVGGVWHATQLRFSDDILAVFPPDAPIVSDQLRYDADYHGAGNFEVLIDSGVDNGVLKPEFLQKLERLSDALTHTHIAGVDFDTPYSVLNIIKETHKALNENDPTAYVIPDQADLIAQELLIFEISNGDDLLDVVDSDFRYARLTLKMTYADGVVYHEVLGEIDKLLISEFGENSAVVTGLTALLGESIPRALSSMLKSYAIALVTIIILMGIMMKSLRIGLVSMIPNLLPIVLVMNVMVFVDWPLDQTTISVGAIALGLVVDDTLHYLFHFKQAYQNRNSVARSAMISVRDCGPALLITTIIYSSASFGNVVSSIKSFQMFGTTLALITVLALLIDLLVTPALLVVMFGGKEKRRREVDEDEKPERYRSMSVSD
ncbi:Uncharacterised protein [BD1-7 clade bacterium]|uniref:SSD domain-containing protein n=1 Tax=BD1-7 clade bacterium TaxID=2029982 RepID=A0A5S9QSJ6_9GAMM|nr:Uncharacterised protein [BD1-7 clade bacterium]CAA0122172.1 Uncharacterised protein [BD1-7 clade bacterium]